ncbi:hypothetical protein COCCADRAFT_109658 [Bipolaris zeicola 26-R-13]|uniref:Uncharacterized protein n=1 Tax=Cochliobolus carbonum (strain 26-R-13) TaxID=930089 RepID=W6XZT2_COCC2|nr:uncharacterized protein COCCADRAFT_109658 [Bipolaris zeicola 26-R-13]EUC28239.1 hypothetical protein COCCADRAFT_109658 [Bipolaris zeicola 26-R-13]
MITIHTRHGGIPALASATHPPHEPLLCTLKILNKGVQFGVILELVLPTHGVADKRLYQLHCGGDNLVPGGNSLAKMDTLSHKLSLSLLRYGETRPGTLSLSLKQPCPLWYPVGLSKLDADFRKLLELARSPAIHIVFDIAWLSDQNLKELKCILGGSQKFISVPVLPELKKSHKEVDWLIINHMQDAAPEACVPAEDQASVVISIEHGEIKAPPFQDEEYDRPPPYAHVSSKRSRHAGPSLTLDAHDLKRATPAPSLCAESTASSCATAPVDLFQEAVTSAVKKVLSHLLRKELLRKKRLLRKKKLLGKKKLAQVVMKVFPQVLEELLQKTSAGHDDPTHDPTFSIIKGAIKSAYESYGEVMDNNLDQSLKSASIELEELNVELKGDLAARAEDEMASCNDHLNEMKAEFDQGVVERVGVLEDYADKVVLNTMDRLNGLLDPVRTRVLHGGGDVPFASEQSQRAMSLPVSKDDKERIAKVA